LPGFEHLVNFELKAADRHWIHHCCLDALAPQGSPERLVTGLTGGSCSSFSLYSLPTVSSRELSLANRECHPPAGPAKYTKHHRLA
jgi:hypothetical protein